MNTEILRDVGRGHEDEPLGHYLQLMGAFGLVWGVGTTLLRLAGRRFPERVVLSDLLVLGLATTRIARLVTQDKVARVVRAPFTEVDPEASPHEVKEQPRVDAGGVRRAIGELVTCPRCVGVWAASGLTFAYVAAPRTTRLASLALAAATISDYANVCFAATRRVGE